MGILAYSASVVISKSAGLICPSDLILVISVSAFSWKLIRKLEQIERDGVLSVLEEARKAGIERVVYLSVYEIREDVLARLKLRFPTARIKLDVERTPERLKLIVVAGLCLLSGICS